MTDNPEPGLDGRLLIVEDDPEDVYILKRALARSPLNINFDVVQNGQEALEYLEESYAGGDLDQLNLILLDLNMPLMDGHEFLQKVRHDSRFRMIPVVVLTTSQEDEILAKAYQDGANAVISKADTLTDMMMITDTIVQFWFNVATSRPKP